MLGIRPDAHFGSISEATPTISPLPLEIEPPMLYFKNVLISEVLGSYFLN